MKLVSSVILLAGACASSVLASTKVPKRPEWNKYLPCEAGAEKSIDPETGVPKPIDLKPVVPEPMDPNTGVPKPIDLKTVVPKMVSDLKAYAPPKKDYRRYIELDIDATIAISDFLEAHKEKGQSWQPVFDLGPGHRPVALQPYLSSVRDKKREEALWDKKARKPLWDKKSKEASLDKKNEEAKKSEEASVTIDDYIQALKDVHRDENGHLTGTKKEIIDIFVDTHFSTGDKEDRTTGILNAVRRFKQRLQDRIKQAKNPTPQVSSSDDEVEGDAEIQQPEEEANPQQPVVTKNDPVGAEDAVPFPENGDSNDPYADLFGQNTGEDEQEHRSDEEKAPHQHDKEDEPAKQQQQPPADLLFHFHSHDNEEPAKQQQQRLPVDPLAHSRHDEPPKKKNFKRPNPPINPNPGPNKPAKGTSDKGSTTTDRNEKVVVIIGLVALALVAIASVVMLTVYWKRSKAQF